MIKDFLNYNLITIGSFTLSASAIVYLIGLAVIIAIMLRLIKKVLYRFNKFDDAQKYTIYTITKYFVLVIYISAALRILGIDVSVIIASSAALFVGIGLGLQGLFNDFLSGIILLVDGTIKVGNVIEVGDKRVEILAIRFRTSVVKTREEKEIIIPNSYFTKNEIVNWSNQKNVNRHYITVQVAEKDVSKAMELMLQTVNSNPKVIQRPQAYVRIEEFTSYAITLRLLFWSEEIFAVGRMLGEIRLNVLNCFRENGIVMPYPQQVITLNQIPGNT